MDVADLVYEARGAAGLTQADLAAHIGIRQGYVSALERGERVPTVSTLARAAEATGSGWPIEVSSHVRSSSCAKFCG